VPRWALLFFTCSQASGILDTLLDNWGESLKTYLEFFAGAGMVRLALAPSWVCVFANDIDKKKTRAYKENFSSNGELVEADIATVATERVPNGADLAWASFPCQDLSIAGKVEGLSGHRSSTFWEFWRVVREKARLGVPLPLVVIENVVGLLYSKSGKDFAAIVHEFRKLRYAVGAFVVDASLFVPQSRARVFIVGVHESRDIPGHLISSVPELGPFYPRKLIDLVYTPKLALQDCWVWWRLIAPNAPVCKLSDIVEWDTGEVPWHTKDQHSRLLSQLSPAHRKKVDALVAARATAVLPIYRRTRQDDSGNKVQRAEARFDDKSGALRTPVGGSSRQLLLFIKGGRTKSRLLSPREAARLMGVPDSYRLPSNYNEAYHLIGDGVVVDVVSWINRHLFEPLLQNRSRSRVA